jgi:lipoprotein-anchoring transpeptidase ErfK/SrfK
MVDYYAILSRAIDTAEANDRSWRRNLYDRARRTLMNEMRARRPQPIQAELARELAALEAAVKRIEAERAPSENTENDPTALPAEPDQSPLLESLRSRPLVLIALALGVAALCAGAYAFWWSHRPGTQASRTPANSINANMLATRDGDIPPGIDGGPMDADQSYVFRRQPTFYRTLQPAGTVIIDKLQHFLYLVQPNSVALRYGIGIGRQCADLIGLRHVASMAEWPPWEAPPDTIRLARACSSSTTTDRASTGPMRRRRSERTWNSAASVSSMTILWIYTPGCGSGRRSWSTKSGAALDQKQTIRICFAMPTAGWRRD